LKKKTFCTFYHTILWDDENSKQSESQFNIDQYFVNYTKYKSNDQIDESYDGVSEERILFENKIKFLLLLQIFGFLGSKKYSELNNINITKNHIKQYIENYDCTNFIDEINKLYPMKAITVYENSSLYILWNYTEKITEDPDYMEYNAKISREYFNKLEFDTFDETHLKDIYENITRYRNTNKIMSNHVLFNVLIQLIKNTDPENMELLLKELNIKINSSISIMENYNNYINNISTEIINNYITIIMKFYGNFCGSKTKTK